MANIRTHARWALDLVLEIDIHSPGFCGLFLRASDERRQVISAYLTERYPDVPSMAEVATFLTSSDHRAILERAYGEVPQGLRGALARSGATVHEQSYYRLLFAHLSEPKHGGIVREIQRMRFITTEKLMQLQMLPQDLCSHYLAEALNSSSRARELAATVDLLVERGVDREHFTAALREIRSDDDLGKMFLRWALKAQCPPHPVEGSDYYRPISTPLELHRLAIEWQNCARRYLVDLLQGTHAFAVFTHDGHQVIAHLLRDTDGVWEREGVWGPRNSRPTVRICNALDEYLSAQGVRFPSYAARERTEWDSLRRFMRSSESFELDMDAVDQELEDLLGPETNES